VFIRIEWDGYSRSGTLGAPSLRLRLRAGSCGSCKGGAGHAACTMFLIIPSGLHRTPRSSPESARERGLDRDLVSGSGVACSAASVGGTRRSQKDAKDGAPIVLPVPPIKSLAPILCKPLFIKQIADARHSPKKTSRKRLAISVVVKYNTI
jgi:hypothetical protein